MSESVFEQIRIVIVEPAGALNVGSIARVMKNMGLQRLVLVNPQCDPTGAEARQMAVHAQDVLNAAQIVQSLPTALQGCHRAIATTGRDQMGGLPIEHPRAALPWLLEAQGQSIASALIFGREDRGLTSTELDYAQRLVSIPTNPAYPSLNLAQAVAICCYELAQAKLPENRDSSAQSPPLPEPPAAIGQVNAYLQHLETVLLQIGYLYPHTANSRMAKLRRLLSRALPSETEVALLRGMLSQVEWAVQQVTKSVKD
jgi:tRNA/rRNA methyltransferase